MQPDAADRSRSRPERIQNFLNCSRIVLASRNPGKVREIGAILAGLAVEVVGLDRIDGADSIPTPAETGESYSENARAKAMYYSLAVGYPALADDSGLEVDALGGAPGVRSARYAAEDFPARPRKDDIDKANNAKLLRELAGIPPSGRTARFVCCVALSDGPETLIEATGVFPGTIAASPRGDNGFGYDPLFFIPELGRTAAELTRGQKNDISHRGRALRLFAAMLEDWLEDPKKGQRPCRK